MSEGERLPQAMDRVIPCNPYRVLWEIEHFETGGRHESNTHFDSLVAPWAKQVVNQLPGESGAAWRKIRSIVSGILTFLAEAGQEESQKALMILRELERAMRDTNRTTDANDILEDMLRYITEDFEASPSERFNALEMNVSDMLTNNTDEEITGSIITHMYSCIEKQKEVARNLQGKAEYVRIGALRELYQMRRDLATLLFRLDRKEEAATILDTPDGQPGDSADENRLDRIGEDARFLFKARAYDALLARLRRGEDIDCSGIALHASTEKHDVPENEKAKVVEILRFELARSLRKFDSEIANEKGRIGAACYHFGNCMKVFNGLHEYGAATKELAEPMLGASLRFRECIRIRQQNEKKHTQSRDAWHELNQIVQAYVSEVFTWSGLGQCEDAMRVVAELEPLTRMSEGGNAYPYHDALKYVCDAALMQVGMQGTVNNMPVLTILDKCERRHEVVNTYVDHLFAESRKIDMRPNEDVLQNVGAIIGWLIQRDGDHEKTRDTYRRKIQTYMYSFPEETENDVTPQPRKLQNI